MAADPEPIVNEAKSALTSWRVSVGVFSRESMVPSTSPRPTSVPTTTPARMRPNSIMSAISSIPLMRPRQALLTSIAIAEFGNPTA